MALRAFSILLWVMILGGPPVLTAQTPDWKVAVLYWSMNIPGQVAMREGLEAEAARINRTAPRKMVLLPSVAGDGEQGIENQILQMRRAVQQKVDAIIVQPTDNAALVPVLLEANQAGIPVVAYDQYISGGFLAAYRTSDNYGAGFLDGEYLASLFSADREIRLVLVDYPHVSSTVERVDGFLDALTSRGRKYRILKTYQAVEPRSGALAARQFLADFPAKGSVDAVFTVNDGGGLAVAEALESAGRSEIRIASVDGDPRSVERLRQGKLTVIDSAQFCGPLGAEALKAAFGLLSGSKVPQHALVPVFPVTKQTLALYPGWQGPLPSPFRKPWDSATPLWQGQLKVVKE